MLHGPLNILLGNAVAKVLATWIGLGTATSRNLVIGLNYVVVLIVLISLSDIVWRLVDAKSVTFARWLQKICFVG